MDSTKAVAHGTFMKVLTALATMTLFLAPVSLANAKPTPSEDAQFQKWLVQYLKGNRDGDDLQNLVYGYALVDLNGGGRNEAIVWARDRYRCGTGGCDAEIFVRGKSGWKLFASSPNTRPPIKLLLSRTKGWRDLAGWQAGGGIMRPYEARWRFNGKEYELVEPADWTGVKPRPPRLNGRVIIKDATIPLFPSKCRRIEEATSVFGPMPVKSGKPGSC